MFRQHLVYYLIFRISFLQVSSDKIRYEYDKAVDCFKAALSKQTADHLLWNKLGATLANSNNNIDAVEAYRTSLSLRPSYIRAHSNLGISHIALRNYNDAAKEFLTALNLVEGGGGGSTGDGSPEHLWEYLELALKLMERPDLIKTAALRNVDFFRDHFDF